MKATDTKYQKMKKKYAEILKLSTDKDIEIAALKHQIKSKQQLENVESNAKIDLSPYKQIFATALLKELENLNFDIRYDSAFVRKIIWYLYGDKQVDEIPTLRKRIKNGNLLVSKNMPPEVCGLIESMLSVRLKAITKSDTDYLHRTSRTSTLISHGLSLLIKSAQNDNAQEN